MRILILNDVAALVGGAEILTYDLRDELRRHGHDARVFASRALGGGHADYECFGTTGPLRTLNRVANPGAAWRLRRVITGFRPHIIHSRMFLTQLSPLVLPILKEIPALYHTGWYEIVCPTGHKLLPGGTPCREPAGRACRRCLSLPAWLALMLQRDLIERWRGVFGLYVAASEIVRRRLEEGGLEPVVRVWNGVPRRPPRPPLTGPPTIAYAGRLAPEKGVETLLDAFPTILGRIADARLWILGTGPLRGAIERRIAALGIADRIVLAGHRTRQAVEAALEAAWIQVVPSLWQEPFGLVVGEALMRGTALVVTEGGGPEELVRASGGGVVVPPGDPVALAGAIRDLLADRERAEALGAAGRAWALERLSLERFGETFLGIYQDLLGG